MTKDMEKNSPQPTSGNIADRIATLSPAKQALLQMKLEKAGLITPSIQSENRASALLSFAQERLWILDRWEPGNTSYNVSLAFSLTGPCDMRALADSLNEIIRRHESLRTNFAENDGYPIQRVAPKLALDIPLIDLKDIPGKESRDRVLRLTGDDAGRPFDLSGEPLIRASLFRLDEEEHVLLVVMHHIVTDGWSMGVFFRELSILYSSFSQGKPSPLPDLPIQYADFSVWQRQWLQGEVLERQLVYWRKQLAGASLLALPTDRPRPPVQTFHGARKAFIIPRALTEALRTLSRSQGVTLFMTLLAVFQLLLHRYSGQEDIAVGSPIANRNRVEIEGLIGFFVNTLVLRTDMGGNPTFRKLLGRVQETALGAYAHQDLPFEKLVEELNPERNPSHTPFFQVMLVLQNAPGENLKLPGLTVEPFAVESKTAKFDLTLSLTEDAGGMLGGWEYNTDLFDETTVERMIGHFPILLEGIVTDPDQRLSELPLLTVAERSRILVEWNDTKADYPKDRCIHKLFEDQAERTPEAVALVFEDREMTYRELNLRSNQLAHYLRKLGVGPEVLVGICLERSPEMVVGILGILKAGGAYLPLDPKYPVERLAFMLEDARTPVILTQQRLREILPQREAALVCLDTDWPAISRETESPPVNGVSADNLAYVIYTSGSTGKPKGVAIEHHSIVALLQWARSIFAPEDLKGVLVSTSLCFDLSVFEIFMPLSYGGTAILVDNILDMARSRLKWDVTLINTVPSAISELVRINGVPDSVCAINLAGEPLHTSIVRQIYRHTRVKRVFDLYGPSEDTVYSTFSLRNGSGPATIGKPISNTRIYLLDSHLQPVPIGVHGELCIAGDGLARGYLNRTELTAEKFIPDPFSDVSGARLYRSGDLARYLPDGNIEFLGRIDHQVKIRGFRIELGEIEFVLGQHPGVREAVALVREDMPGDKRLIAYVVPIAGSLPATGELRRFLAEKLPDYMVPSAFVTLDALPLTPSGKVDRRALPAPDHARPELGCAYTEPVTPLEIGLAKIWADVLGVERVGVNDNFFDLGGHSLLAVMLFSKINKITRINLPLATLLNAPTVKTLASIIEHLTLGDEGNKGISSEIKMKEWGETDSHWRCLIAIQPDGNLTPLFLAHAAGGNVLNYRVLIEHLGQNQPLYGLQAKGLDGTTEPFTSIEAMAAHFIEEIRTVQPQGPYLLGGGSFGGMVAYEMARQLNREGENIGLLALFDTFGPGSLEYDSFFDNKIHKYLLKIKGVLTCINELKATILYNSNKITCQFHKILRRPIPIHLREWYITRHNSQLLKRYNTAPYEGTVTLFRSSLRDKRDCIDPTLGWCKLAKSVVVIDIPAIHIEFIEEPELGRALNLLLMRLRASA